MPNSEQLQKQHYERISKEYDAHYNDLYSRQYLHLVAFDSMFNGIELQDKSVLEAMCGGGQTAGYLIEKGAKITGLDISLQQTRHFKLRHPTANTLCASILNSSIANDSFDVISVVGGIHHLPPNINEAIIEFHRILKPGGYLCFMEPHSESVAEIFRQPWYKYDPLFAKNESAICMSELCQTFKDHFDFKKENYLGNVGYLFVLNSMVLRIPLKLKPLYSPMFIKIETFLNKVLGKYFSCFVAAQWKKNEFASKFDLLSVKSL